MKPEELRQQRARVAEHLAWLDRQIAELEAGASGAVPAALPTQVPPSLPPALVAEQAASAPGDIPVDAPDRPIVQGVSSGQKLGCILMVIGVIGAILFAIFGLPYLIYDDTPPPAGDHGTP